MDEAGRAQLSQDAQSLLRFFGAIIGDADIQGFALAYYQIEGSHGLFQWRIGIGAVVVEDIYIFQAHALQALVETGHQVFFRAPFAIGAFPHQVASLGGDNQFIPISTEVLMQQAAKVFLG